MRKLLPTQPQASVCQKIKYCDVRKGKTPAPSGGPRAASWHPQARETDQSGGPTDQPAGQSGCGVPQGCPGNMITGWYAVVGRTWPSCRLAPRAGMVQLYDPLEYSCIVVTERIINIKNQESICLYPVLGSIHLYYLRVCRVTRTSEGRGEYS